MLLESHVRLGVNIDHVATIRNARGSMYPDPVEAAILAQNEGADGITAHLREDRRHIRDKDVDGLIAALNIPLNFEMAATEEMQKIALKHKPHAVCLVPEKREERTTEGGLDVLKEENKLREFIKPLSDSGCRVSLFIAAAPAQIEAAERVGAAVVELHTGTYCDYFYEQNQSKCETEFENLKNMCEYANSIGLEVHAGHGLTYETVSPIAAFPELKELNIGHFLISDAVFNGLGNSIKKMKKLIGEARAS
jgi:pyridoxine 5-phosphate synthase